MERTITMLKSASRILLLMIGILPPAAQAKGGPGACGPVPPTPLGWSTPTPLHVAAQNGTAPYGTLFGVQIAARKLAGSEVVVAVGSFDTKKIEVFFLNSDTLVQSSHQSLMLPEWVPGATGMKMGDVNGDSRPDIVVAPRGQGKVAVFLANASGPVSYPGSPIFLPLPSPSPSGTYPYNFAHGNLDLVDDGDEIAVTERGTSSGKNVTPNKIHLFRWLAGSSTFTNYRTVNAPSGSGVIASIAIGDMIDGMAPDLALSDPKADSDSGRVYVFSGDTDFSPDVTVSRGVRDESFGVEIAAKRIKTGSSADPLDLVVATFSSSAYIYSGPPPLSRTDVLAAGQANSMAAGDVNGDDLADLVIGDPFSCNGAGAAYVFLSNPEGPTPLPVPEKSYVLGPPEIIGPSSGIGFGFRVQAVEGTSLLLISAKSIPVGSKGSGQVYVYRVNP